MSETTASETPRTAPEIAQECKLGPEARARLVEGMQPEPFLDALQAGSHFVDACRFLAHALPKRKAVMWACACARQVLDPEAVEGDGALQRAESWTVDPSEDNRWEALQAGEVAETGALGGLSALAAGLSGGSLAPPHVTPVPPGERETARVVAGVVLLAAVQAQPEKAPEKFARFLELGREIWLRPLPPPPAPKAETDSQAQVERKAKPAFDDTASIARGWSEPEPEQEQSVAAPANAAPPPPVAPPEPAPTERRLLRPKTLMPLSRPRREAPPAKDSKTTFNDTDSIGKTSFEDE